MILIVEDDAPIREMLELVLEEEGYAVQSAANGQEALAILQTLPKLPKLILLDLMMPVMDGWTFRQKQLADPTLMNVPVVVLSAAYELPRQATNIRAASFLAKPVNIAELVATVAHHHA